LVSEFAINVALAINVVPPINVVIIIKTFLLSAYMKYIRERNGFIPKILNFFFAQNMIFTDKKS
jgi:hypothetical protein